jgi:hypothetical protein
MGDKNYLPLHPQLAPLELRVFLYKRRIPSRLQRDVRLRQVLLGFAP